MHDFIVQLRSLDGHVPLPGITIDDIRMNFGSEVVALIVHLKQPNSWSGSVLVTDDMVPPWTVVTRQVIGINKLIPKQKLVPQVDLAKATFREPTKRDQCVCNVMDYGGKFCLRTVLQSL